MFGGKKYRKSTKRKSTKRKSTKRKSTKRKSLKRKSTKRKSLKRKSTKRKSIKKKSTKRKSIKRKSQKAGMNNSLVSRPVDVESPVMKIIESIYEYYMIDEHKNDEIIFVNQNSCVYRGTSIKPISYLSDSNIAERVGNKEIWEGDTGRSNVGNRSYMSCVSDDPNNKWWFTSPQIAMRIQGEGFQTISLDGSLEDAEVPATVTRGIYRSKTLGSPGYEMAVIGQIKVGCWIPCAKEIKPDQRYEVFVSQKEDGSYMFVIVYRENDHEFIELLRQNGMLNYSGKVEQMRQTFGKVEKMRQTKTYKPGESRNKLKPKPKLNQTVKSQKVTQERRRDLRKKVYHQFQENKRNDSLNELRDKEKSYNIL